MGKGVRTRAQTVRVCAHMMCGCLCGCTVQVALLLTSRMSRARAHAYTHSDTTTHVRVYVGQCWLADSSHMHGASSSNNHPPKNGKPKHARAHTHTHTHAHTHKQTTTQTNKQTTTRVRSQVSAGWQMTATRLVALLPTVILAVVFEASNTFDKVAQALNIVQV